MAVLYTVQVETNVGLAEFLGLDSHDEMITAAQYRSRQTQLVDMSAIFAERNFKGPVDLQQLIETNSIERRFPQPLID